MKKYIHISLTAVMLLFAVLCLSKYCSRNIPIEECLVGEVHLSHSRGAAVASGVLDSKEALTIYLQTREFYGYEPFIGQALLDSLHFSEYDYMLAEGQPIIKLIRLGSDECSSYDHNNLIPVEPIFGDSISLQVYVYKISPKNKYRGMCN